MEKIGNAFLREDRARVTRVATRATSLAIAKRFLAMGVSPEKVAEATLLPLDKVRALAEKSAA